MHVIEYGIVPVLLTLLSILAFNYDMVEAEICKTGMGFPFNYCEDLTGRRKNLNEDRYHCFAEGLEYKHCKCRQIDAVNDPAWMNSRMMCVNSNHYVGDEWHDNRTCQRKTCNENEQVETLNVGCRKIVPDNEISDPEKSCVDVGFYPFRCQYENNIYDNCECLQYDNLYGQARPILCGTHLAGEVYDSNCQLVECTIRKIEKIITRRCQAADGQCYEDPNAVFPCYINGLWRGACMCDQGCNKIIENKQEYQVDIKFSKAVPNGDVIVSLSGTINDSPIIKLNVALDKMSASIRTSVQYVGIPRKLIFQFVGEFIPNDPKDNFTQRGGTLDSITLQDISNNTVYNYNITGVNHLSNKQFSRTLGSRQSGWVNGEDWKYVESVCIEKECTKSTMPSHNETYELEFYCPNLNATSVLSVRHVLWGLAGEQLFTGLNLIKEFNDPDFKETKIENYILHQKKTYRFPYCGKVISLILYFPGQLWPATCTLKVNVPKRQQYFEFKYLESSVKKNTSVLACISGNCGQKDWDLVCDSGKLKDSCTQDQCCSKIKPPCGKLCYVPDQTIYNNRDQVISGHVYKGKWKISKTGKTCLTPCSNSDNYNNVPKCMVEGGGMEECDIPVCEYLNCNIISNKCFVIVPENRVRAEAKDTCFEKFGGRLVIIQENNDEYKQLFYEAAGPKKKSSIVNLVWAEGIFHYRSPVRWGTIHTKLFPDLLQPSRYTRGRYFVHVKNNEELDNCMLGSDSTVYGSNCIRAGRPFCEINMITN